MQWKKTAALNTSGAIEILLCQWTKQLSCPSFLAANQSQLSRLFLVLVSYFFINMKKTVWLICNCERCRVRRQLLIYVRTNKRLTKLLYKYVYWILKTLIRRANTLKKMWKSWYSCSWEKFKYSFTYPWSVKYFMNI